MKEDHPSLLPWYVSGVIGRRERQAVLSHLEACGTCRAEVLALASMRDSLRIQDRVEHVAPADLALYEEDLSSLSAERRASIQGHLAECADCRQDLAILGRARRESETALPAATGRPAFGRRSILAAAAVLVVLVAGGWSLWLRKGAADLRIARVTSVVFQAPSRGGENERTLRGTGPWAIRVLLPFGAARGGYRVAVRPAGGAWLPELGSTVATDPDLCLNVALRVLPGPGRYEMALRHEPPESGEPYLYPFELLPASVPGSGS